MVKKFWIVVSNVKGVNANYNANTRFEEKSYAIAWAGKLAAQNNHGFVVMEAMDFVEVEQPPLKVTPIRG